MSQPLQYISIHDISTPIASQIADDSKTIICGPAAFETHQLELTREVGRSAFRPGLTIFPLGVAGAFQWTRLPLEIARLTSRPTLSACVIVDAAYGQTWKNAEQMWNEIVNVESDQITIADPVRDLVVQADWASLAPGSSTIPKWLTQAATNFGVPGGASSVDVEALRAGLLQVHDQLDHSHQYSQSIEGEGRNAAGDYWHAIMHRREPDYGNSKYWFRRVGEHPIFPELASVAFPLFDQCDDSSAPQWKSRITGNGWDPMAFVDLCQNVARDESSPLGVTAREIQWLEMLLLLEQTYADAMGQ